MRLTLLQRIHLWLYGWAESSRMIRKPGWTGSLPSYVIRCSEHGLVENVATGWDEIIHCPYCDYSTTKMRNVYDEFP